MTRRSLLLTGTAAALTIALSGCVAKSTGTVAIAVEIADDACAVATAHAPAGPVTFQLANRGTDVNEFEILAEDQLRVVGEKENVTPGQEVAFTAQLEPGTYYTACKFQQVGAPIGLAKFSVTGQASAVSLNDQAMTDRAIDEYLAYVRSQVAELLPAVQRLVAAYTAGDDRTARSYFAATRAPYERIEPTAEAFGDLDPRIDFREVDAVADGIAWTGFHRIEKDLWPPEPGELNSDGQDAFTGWSPSTPAERQLFADQLVADITELHALVTADEFTVSLADISNGAIGLLDEVASAKITGEEDWWSGTDLSDFAANVQGAGVAFGSVRALAASKGATGNTLVNTIDRQFTTLQATLATYGSIEDGFLDYATLTNADKKALSDQVNALAEPLSQLTRVVLGAH
jgi:iron uptake system component EfeO